MKYIIRLLAALPALGVGISVIFFFVLSFDVPVLVILAALNSLALILLLYYYENIVSELINFIQILLNKTPSY